MLETVLYWLWGDSRGLSSVISLAILVAVVFVLAIALALFMFVGN